MTQHIASTPPPGPRGAVDHLDEELERRLAILESPDFDDPARRDLPARDYLGLLAANVMLILLFLLWLA